jgi:hypothetical protein
MSTSSEQSIIFVYNADSGIINTVKDYWHKIIKPSTYECNLCALTFNNLGMKNEWRTFVDDLGIPVEFIHRDEWMKMYPKENVEFPVAFLKRGDKLKLFINHEEINKCKTLDELMELVKNKMKSNKY